MFNIGDHVKVADDFEGSITVAGWRRPDIQLYTFEVVSFDDYQKTNPEFAKIIKKQPAKQGEVFLRYHDEIFALSPTKALSLVQAADAICNCPINQLWAGRGHNTICPEFPQPS